MGGLPCRQGRVCEARRRIGASRYGLVPVRAISDPACRCSDAVPGRRGKRGRFAEAALRGRASPPRLCGRGPHSQYSSLESPRADRSLGPARMHRLGREGRRRARGRRRQFRWRQQRRPARALRFDFAPGGSALLVGNGMRLADSDHPRDSTRRARARPSATGFQRSPKCGADRSFTSRSRTIALPET